MNVEFFLILMVAVIAAGVAFAFFLQYSALKKADDSRRQDADEAVAKAKKAQTEAEGAREELTRRKAEAAELREKLNDIRQRNNKKDQERAKKSGQNELTDQLDDARRALDEERTRLDVIQREASGMQDDITRLRDANKKLEEAHKAALAAAARVSEAPARPMISAAPSTPAPFVAPERPESEIKAKLEAAETQLRDARRRQMEAETDAKGARGRVSTSNRQQLLTKSELDLFKEKLVWSEKRVVELEKLLFDNKVALPERETAPQPKAPQIAPGILARESANTGGEGVVAGSADYVPDAPEAPAAASVVEIVAAPAAAVVVVAAPAVSAEVAAAASPAGVVRRPKADVEASNIK